MQPDTQTTRHLVQAAEQLLPTLKARSLEIDQLRQVPQDLAETLAAQGFYRICTPAALRQHLPAPARAVAVRSAAPSEVSEVLRAY